MMAKINDQQFSPASLPLRDLANIVCQQLLVYPWLCTAVTHYLNSTSWKQRWRKLMTLYTYKLLK